MTKPSAFVFILMEVNTSSDSYYNNVILYITYHWILPSRNTTAITNNVTKTAITDDNTPHDQSI